MTAQSYKHLALTWVPDDQDSRLLYIVLAAVFCCLLPLSYILSSMDIPEKNNRVREKVPDRVAEFVTRQKQDVKPTPAPTPLATPKPIATPLPTPTPNVVRQRPSEEKDTKPLTDTQQKAREKAQSSGLLALGNDLADLIDTTDVKEMVNSNVHSASDAATKSASANTDILTKGAAAGSGGVKDGDYVAGVSGNGLSQREIAAVKQTLLSNDRVNGKATNGAQTNTGRATGGSVRSEEEVSIIFDRNKSKLQSIYNRERRKNPGLRGKIVLELTIGADGSVTSARVISSELNSPELEKKLLARIKLFNFGAKNVKSVTVTFPIEFLPS